MLNKGFVLSSSDAQKVDEIKQSEVFGRYIKSIASSPIYRKIISTYIEQINITPDMTQLKGSKIIPDNMSNDGIKALNEIFKLSIKRLLPVMMAEVILMKEIEDINVDDIINDVKKEEDVLYILGLANEEYYIEAEKLLSDNKLSDDDPLLHGLIEYRKKNKSKSVSSITTKPRKSKVVEPKIVSEKPIVKTETEKTKVNITDRHIRL